MTVYNVIVFFDSLLMFTNIERLNLYVYMRYYKNNLEQHEMTVNYNDLNKNELTTCNTISLLTRLNLKLFDKILVEKCNSAEAALDMDQKFTCVVLSTLKPSCLKQLLEVVWSLPVDTWQVPRENVSISSVVSSSACDKCWCSRQLGPCRGRDNRIKTTQTNASRRHRQTHHDDTDKRITTIQTNA